MCNPSAGGKVELNLSLNGQLTLCNVVTKGSLWLGISILTPFSQINS